MKDPSLLAVVTADQVASRTRDDQVPTALEALTGTAAGWLLPFDRTVGDELQGLTDQPESVVDAVITLTRLGGWRIGVGLGSVDLPLPANTREARGSAYLNAREAVTAARQSPTELALRAPVDVSGESYGEGSARDAETALILLRWVSARRTAEGWEVMQLLDSGLTGREAAEALGVTPSAVSQRATRAARAESERGRELAVRLLGRAMRVPS